MQWGWRRAEKEDGGFDCSARGVWNPFVFYSEMIYRKFLSIFGTSIGGSEVSETLQFVSAIDWRRSIWRGGVLMKPDTCSCISYSSTKAIWTNLILFFTMRTGFVLSIPDRVIFSQLAEAALLTQKLNGIVRELDARGTDVVSPR